MTPSTPAPPPGVSSALTASPLTRTAPWLLCFHIVDRWIGDLRIVLLPRRSLLFAPQQQGPQHFETLGAHSSGAWTALPLGPSPSTFGACFSTFRTTSAALFDGTLTAATAKYCMRRRTSICSSVLSVWWNKSDSLNDALMESMEPKVLRRIPLIFYCCGYQGYATLAG